ncbi:MAG: hypothetical protein Aurels2KO_18330 [Aureliella sp.]
MSSHQSVSGLRSIGGNALYVRATRTNDSLQAELDRFRPTFACPNTDAIVHWQHKDLAIADLASVTCFSRL